MDGEDSEEDEDDGPEDNEYYAGGEKSGVAVRGGKKQITSRISLIALANMEPSKVCQMRECWMLIMVCRNGGGFERAQR